MREVPRADWRWTCSFFVPPVSFLKMDFSRRLFPPPFFFLPPDVMRGTFFLLPRGTACARGGISIAAPLPPVFPWRSVSPRYLASFFLFFFSWRLRISVSANPSPSLRCQGSGLSRAVSESSRNFPVSYRFFFLPTHARVIARVLFFFFSVPSRRLDIRQHLFESWMPRCALSYMALGGPAGFFFSPPFPFPPDAS